MLQYPYHKCSKLPVFKLSDRIWLLLIRPGWVWKRQMVPLASLEYENQGLSLEILRDTLSRNYENAFYRVKTYLWILLSGVDTD